KSFKITMNFQQKIYCNSFCIFFITNHCQSYFIRICYAVTNSDKLGATLICDEEYPKRVAIDFLLKIHGDFKTFIAEKKIDISLYTNDTDLPLRLSRVTSPVPPSSTISGSSVWRRRMKSPSRWMPE
ncbi:MAG: hypothetical protein II652_06255, partial [Bacteroidales bacterium]|nr:hypothetical protein [Bacteroidales bacterium]